MSKLNKKKIILVGYKSFIQTNLFGHLKNKFFVKKLRFKEINKKNVEGFDIIINCSNSKNFFDKQYEKKYDRNLKIANIIKATKTKLFLLSSRQVYAQKLFLTEKSTINPLNTYSKNCVMSEKLCKKILKNNLLILRLSNVFGLEKGKKKKPSMVSLIIQGLKKGKIIMDNNYFLHKDFLPIQLLCLHIEKLANLNLKGILNIGSGIPYLVKDFIDEFIDSSKTKIKIQINKKFNDKSYCFNIEKLNNLSGIKFDKKKLNVYLLELKNKLA